MRPLLMTSLSSRTSLRTSVRVGLLATWMALGTGTAQAHVSIANPTATAGSYTKVVLQLPHGCAGSATTAVTVYLPPAYLVAKPMPKPGWTVTVQKARLARPVVLHGRPIEDSPSVIRWEGGRLPGDFFDEFVLFGKLDDQAAGPLPFRTVQTCEQGEADWSGAAGSSTPVPLLQVTPAAVSAAAPPAPASAIAPAPVHQHVH